MRKILIIVFILVSIHSFSQGELTDPDGNPIDPATITELNPPLLPGEVGVTEGSLSVSNNGIAMYNIPILIPPGIKGVEPKISLQYNSRSGRGIAGENWNIGGVSKISRIPSTIFHDGISDPVDFDGYDRFAIDGQRLILKTGVYGQVGSTYETEIFSNIKVSLLSQSSGDCFKAEYPDGSVAYYSKLGSNANFNLDWVISRWENVQGLKIVYNYSIISIPNNGITYIINDIVYGSTNLQGINKIEFIYKNKNTITTHKSYIGGYEFPMMSQILSQIKIKGNGSSYKNYELIHDLNSFGYERLKSINEKTGDETKVLNPLNFTYSKNQATLTQQINYNTRGPRFLFDILNTNYIKGDFDGDGEIEILTDYNSKLHLYKIDNNNELTEIYNQSDSYSYLISRSLVRTLDNDKLSNKDLFVLKGTGENINGQIYKGIKICSYNNLTNTIDVLFEKKIDNYGSDYGSNTYQSLKDEGQVYEKYLWGDFDGDNITDVIKIKSKAGLVRTAFCSLNPNLGDYSVDSGTINVGISNYTFNPDNYNGNLTITGNSLIEEGDYDGDGKMDLFVFKGAPYNKIDIYSLINGSFTLVYSTNYTLPSNLEDKFSRSDYVPGSVKYKVVLGDFTNDGKCDVFLPTDGKILESTGITTQVFNEQLLPSTFIKPSAPFTETYYISDMDNDGRLDILRIKPTLDYESTTSYPVVNVGYSSTGYPVTQSVALNGYNYNYGLVIDLYKRGVSTNVDNWIKYNFNKIFRREFGGVDSDPNDDNKFNQLMLPLFSRKNNSETTNVDLAILGTEGISYINFNSNQDRQNLIHRIEQVNGENKSLYYSFLENDNGVYFKSTSLESYPYYNVLNNKNITVVSEINEINSIGLKIKQYKYQGAIFDVLGRGISGFQSSVVTNWFVNNDDIISTVNKFDFTKNGTIKESFTKLGLLEPNYELLSSDTFISKTEYSYNNEETNYIEPLLPNKVFKLTQTKVENTNGLTNVKTETSVVYNINNSPIQSTTITKNDSATEQTVVSNFNYNSTLSTPYLLDRPSSKTITATLASGDISSSEEIYTYDSSKPNLIKEIKKRVTNSGETSEFITETNEYDIYGNIIQNKISAPNLAERKISYEYDTTTHRFMTKKTDVDNLVTEYTYDMSTGNVLTELLPSNSGFPLITTNLYDKWGKVIKQTNYLGKSENFTYKNTYGGIIITQSGSDGSSSKMIMDSYGNTLHKGVEQANTKWSVTSIEYNINNQPVRIYQPYFDGEDRFTWDEITYDIYGRIEKENHLKSGQGNGKVTTYDYTGLITTEFDGQRARKITKNALNQVVTLEENPGVQVNYTYFANGNLKSTTSSGATTTILQDPFGRKKTLIDPSAGTRHYTYNHFGELKEEEVVGKGKVEYDIDDFGKVLEKRTFENTVLSARTLYTYDTKSNLTNIGFNDLINNSTTTYEYKYDPYFRIDFIEEINPEFKFKHKLEYDGFGRAYQENFIATSVLNNKVSDRWIRNSYKKGYKTRIQDMPVYGSVGVTLWQCNTFTASGQPITTNLGNGTVVTNTYDIYGFPTEMKHQKGLTNIMTLTNEFDVLTGNLKKRTNSMFGSWSEDLSYDALDRLTTWRDVAGVQNQAYNDNGTISTNKIGNYAYTINGKPYQVSTITPTMPSATYDYYANRMQNITYNVANNPTSITEANAENIDFVYNAFDDRAIMYYGGLQPLKQDRPYRKYYAADGSMEIKRNIASADVEFVTYIGGDGYNTPVVLKSNGTTQEYLYLHRDYQGSILGITNANGVVLEKRMFDVWGTLIQYANSSGVTTVPTVSTALLLDRGYTGHEHLLGVNVINMNGRIYDDKLHRFFQPDNNIQNPLNAQNFNRYAYVMNNPTKYSDPTGEFWQFFIGALVNSYVAGYQASGGEFNPFKWDSTTWANTALGGASFSASNIATNYSNNYIENYDNPQIRQIEEPMTKWTEELSSVDEYGVLINDVEKKYGIEEGHAFAYYKKGERSYKSKYFNALYNYSFLEANARATGDSDGFTLSADASYFKQGGELKFGKQGFNGNAGADFEFLSASADLAGYAHGGKQGIYGYEAKANIGAQVIKVTGNYGFTVFGAKFNFSSELTGLSAHAGHESAIYYDTKTGIFRLNDAANFGWIIGGGGGIDITIPFKDWGTAIQNFLKK
ncbi:RHS repeat-associated core domain-containing protein [Flavobacterium sp. J27]|uniref:RHS repeat-associated core domain-containing protein n=1 Tax=Flavobacterium sp. J27 TaxID=2060419 RepID=UPI00103031FC|nr:RHS repeat-associated core domain-containing protein [Flavobacterium sp. J27]